MEGMKNTIMGYTGTTIRIHYFMPSKPKVSVLENGNQSQQAAHESIVARVVRRVVQFRFT